MAFSYGFFNSHSGDRTYSAKQFGSIFDGIINDGVFRTIGQQFKVSAGDGMKVKVGSGRGWFNHTWVLNTSDYTVSIPQSEVLLNRVDALVLEIDHRDDYRRTRLTVIKGPAENLEPTWPPSSNVKSMFNFWDTDDQKQIPIAYIRVLGKVTQINTVDLFSVVGKASYGGPAFVTGPLETVDLSEIYSQIQAQWNTYYQGVRNQWNTFYQNAQSQWNTYYQNAKNQWDTFYPQTNAQWFNFVKDVNAKWNQNMRDNYLAWSDWFEHLQYVLDGDVAGHLQEQIDRLGFDFDVNVIDKVIFFPLSGAQITGNVLHLPLSSASVINSKIIFRNEEGG